jgi:two-component system response regulator AtoC
VRIVAATNRNIDKAVSDGTFREDLYHRLNVIPIILTPLRERPEDIAELAGHFLQRFSVETKKSFSTISADAEATLMAYSWPGNVRELANVIERAVVLGDGPVLTIDLLPARIATLKSTDLTDRAEATAYHETINHHRRELILKALSQAGGNRAAAAKALGLHRTHLLKLIKALQLG